MLGGCGALGRYLTDLHHRWCDENPDMTQEATGRPDAWPIWDEVALAYLRGWTTWEDMPRQRLVDADQGFAGQTDGTVRWVTSIDSGRLWQEMVEDVRLHAG